ncbi:hypothetical protein ACNVED_01040 [Legionella sp. D16C41]|uniref:hypothetical protein n=1 Tax=Legionella sp. D16C41 TaxID=3402688 RepID=UPI003AF8B388
MSCSENIVKALLKRKEIPQKAASNNKLLDSTLFKKIPNIPFNLVELCDATARITKMLLGLGAENNWEDIQRNKGRSMAAGLYRSNWLYLSRTDHGRTEKPPKCEQKQNWEAAIQEGQQTFFYYPPKLESKNNKSIIERNAAAAVLSLTGSCDQHAYVLATLLRAILPLGTPIHLCGLKMFGKNIHHTFVVVGFLNSKKYLPLNTLPIHSLLVADAWPTIGGAVPLADFFICEGQINDGVLLIDKSYLADGKDYLIKRIRKQKILLDMAKSEFSNLSTKPSDYLSTVTYNTLQEQADYPKLIKRNKYLAKFSDYDELFLVPTISEKYKMPVRSQQAYDYICENYPHKDFKRCLEYVQEQVKKVIENDKDIEGDFTMRLNAGW